MPRKFKTVGLWGRLNEPTVAEPASQILEHLRNRGVDVLVATQPDGSPQLAGASHLDEAELAKRIDLLIAIGGDGTLLSAARHVAQRGVPLIGINRGRLGFLTDISPEHMRDAIDAILGGDYLEERRPMLAAEIGNAGRAHPALLALNDVVLQKGETGRMLDFVTSVDGSYVNTHRGDGLIVATPTGSTAYALSCGGPIIQPDVDALVMVPICPHTLSDRPLLVKSSSSIEVRVETDVDSAAHVVCDGEQLGKIGNDETLHIRLAEHAITLLHPRDYNYYELLRSKLNWGRAKREKSARDALERRMLSLIRVKNYAVIDEVELEFAPGFSVMTGETGAGKSILVDALGLALGDRADAAAVRQGTERAEISVSFDYPPGHAAGPWLRERGLDDGDSCTLRRVIGAEGRSRAFINGQPATLQDLKTLGGLLLDIHGQHAHQSLLEAAQQRALLDAHGDLDEIARRVAETYAAWQGLAADLAKRHGASTERLAQLELLRFQVGELEALGLSAGEPASLRAERDRLANTDKLLTGVSSALDRLFENDAAAYSAVVHAGQELDRIVEHDVALRAPRAQLAAVEIELREIESALNHYRDGIEADPARLEWLEERLGKTRSLSRRHGVAEHELAELLDTLQKRLHELDGGEESLEALAAKVDGARSAYFDAAAKLSAGRAKQARVLGKQVTAQLAELGIPHGEFQVELERKPEERADGTGMERIEFQVKLNPGQPFGPLSRMASGGELSRISLALEVVRSGASPVPTFVFDEVDAGIGGRVAEIVGRKLSLLAASRQVLCVTHLPQVASQGRQHYRVVKLTDGKTSRTNVRHLSAEERIEELSRMLGGIEITERTRAHAAEMIDRAAK